MQTHEIKQVFNRTFKGQKNIMTPNVIRYGSKCGVLYELSEGRGIGEEKIFGVTLLLSDGTRPEEDQSKMCSSLREAESYIQSLGKAGVK